MIVPKSIGSNNTMNRNHKINLKVLSHLKKGDKLNTNFQLFQIESGSLGVTSFFRMLRGDNRNFTIESIAVLVDETIRTADSHTDEEDVHDIKRYLHGARSGIYNLSVTYANDITAKAGLQIVLERIDKCIGVNQDGDIETHI